MRATERTVLVTGGLGALGSVIVRRFLEGNFRVAIPGTPGIASTDLPREFHPWEKSVFIRGVELTSETEVESFLAEASGAVGPVDIVVNAAGGFAGGQAIGEASRATLEQMLSSNLMTAFLMCTAVLPGMRVRKFGRIITIAAMPAVSPTAHRGPYAIAKRGVITLTETIAEEVKGTGITANAIAPSIILTPANSASMPGADSSRWVAPEEIASLILFLSSDSARSISGNVIKVYGGV